MARASVALLSLAICRPDLAAVHAQTASDKAPTALAAGLGLKASDLEIRAPGQFRANPVEGASESKSFSASSSGVSDVVGTLSVQDFQGTQQALSCTHASADGFRNYLANWYRPNFVYRDAGVGVWQYHDQYGGDNYDLWTSNGTDYGIDGVLTCFTSTHGVTVNNLYTASMGQNWGGRGWDARSDRMALGGNSYGFGDERLRYFFLDTCQSVKISGGNDPYATWGVRSKGVRMVFGFETNSFDDPDMGSGFWAEWNNGHTLATSWLNASWYHVSTGQSPCVVAFGATMAEASSRRDSERYLAWGAVSNNYGAWTWYYATKSAAAKSADALAVPAQAARVEVAARGNSDAETTRLARAIGFTLDDPSAIESRPTGARVVNASGATLVVEEDGDFELMIDRERPAAVSARPPAQESLVARAEQLAAMFDSVEPGATRPGLVRDLMQAEGGRDAAGPARVSERTVIIDQLVNGAPFVDPDAGHFEVTFDARTGEVTNVRSSMKTVAASAKADVPAELRSVEEARALALATDAAPPSPGAEATPPEIVPGSERVGYHMENGRAVPVYEVALTNPDFATSRPRQVRIPLLAVK